MNSVITGNFEAPDTLSVMMGKERGVSTLDKFGVNLNITTASDPEDIWEYGGVYNFSDIADIDTLSSSSTSDVGTLITIYGIYDLNIQGEQRGYAELNGQNKVLIYDNPGLTGDPISFWRVYRMENDSDAGGELVGMLYCYVDTAISGGVPTDTTKIRAVINDGNNKTLMAIYTMPPKTSRFPV